MLVELQDKKGKCIALGQYTSLGEVAQCKGTCNKAPAKGVLGVYRSHAPKWDVKALEKEEGKAKQESQELACA
jgi:hypothetical protein